LPSTQSPSPRELGALGESLAARHLEARGYRILARNARCAGVEIDLIARRGALVAFVEVKTRRGRWAGAPEEAVDARKLARLRRGAAAWLREHGAGVASARFDVITCEPIAGGELRLRHLEGIWDGNA
jgi:putative endonuclease